MRGFELNAQQQAIEHRVAVSEQPLAHPEMQVQPSPILRFMMEDRMRTALLFSNNRMLGGRNPFSLPQLPDELRAGFDIGGGGS